MINLYFNNRELAEKIVNDILIALSKVTGVGQALEIVSNESYDNIEELLIQITEKTLND